MPHSLEWALYHYFLLNFTFVYSFVTYLLLYTLTLILLSHKLFMYTKESWHLN